MLTRRSGFSLLELMIAITIMATLTLFSSSSIQQAIKSRLKIQEQIDETSRVRDAIRLIERDVQLAFHYVDLELEFNQSIRKYGTTNNQNNNANNNGQAQAQGQQPGGQTQPNGQNPNQQQQTDAFSQIKDISQDPSRISPVTDFIGEENELNFPTLNSGQLAEGQKQAEYVEVGYKLASCRRPGAEGPSVSCLVRRMSPYVDSDVKKGGKETVLLDGVTEFKLRYIGAGKQDWVKTWKTKEGDAVTNKKFPEMVEISLTVDKSEKDKKKKISMQIVVPIRFPNNYEPPKTDSANANGANGANGTNGAGGNNLPSGTGSANDGSPRR